MVRPVVPCTLAVWPEAPDTQASPSHRELCSVVAVAPCGQRTGGRSWSGPLTSVVLVVTRGSRWWHTTCPFFTVKPEAMEPL